MTLFTIEMFEALREFAGKIEDDNEVRLKEDGSMIVLRFMSQGLGVWVKQASVFGTVNGLHAAT